MAQVPNLRSPRDKVGRLVYFGRMLDKIRLHAAGKLPADYVANFGTTQPRVFDSRCCNFLGISFKDLSTEVLRGASDEELLAWAHAHGTPRSDFDCELFNTFMLKRGIQDEASATLLIRIKDAGLEAYPIQSFFDFIDADEGYLAPKA